MILINDYFIWTRRYGEQDCQSAPTSEIFVQSGPIGSDVFLYSKRMLRYRKNVKNLIRLLLRESSFVRLEFDSSLHLSKKTELDYIYPFVSFSVDLFCGRTDR